MNEYEEQFVKELKELLFKYNVELTAQDNWEGYSECGQDLNIHAEAPMLWNEERQEWECGIDIDFGRFI